MRHDLIRYDGQCGLCHAWVRFLLIRDAGGGLFRFSPLSEPGSTVVVETTDGCRLERSAAVLYLLHRLGGGWRIIASVARLAPRPLRDWLYDRVAAVRRHLFRRPAGVCPAVPDHLRGRFQL